MVKDRYMVNEGESRRTVDEGKSGQMVSKN